MKRIIALAVLFSGLTNAFAQKDSTLIKELNRPIETCETIAFNSQEMLSGYSITQTKEILEIVTIWEEACGNIEAIQRMKILLEISNKTFVDTAYTDYITNYMWHFKVRVEASNEENFKEIYETNKAYFDYLPLKSSFDNWTKEIAAKLKHRQAHGESGYLMCVLFSEEIKDLESQLKTKVYNESYINTTLEEKEFNSWNLGLTFTIKSGMWIPLGQLDYIFNPSPQIGLSWGASMKNKWRFEALAAFNIWLNDEDFELNVDNGIVATNSNFGGLLGILIAKEHKLKNKIYFDGVAGIALSTISTDIEKPNSTDDESSYYSVETVDLSLGFNIRKRVFSKRSIGLNLMYHYTPYNLDKELQTDIGDHAITLNLFYRF